METPKAIHLRSLADQTPDGRVRRLAEEGCKKMLALTKPSTPVRT